MSGNEWLLGTMDGEECYKIGIDLSNSGKSCAFCITSNLASYHLMG